MAHPLIRSTHHLMVPLNALLDRRFVAVSVILFVFFVGLGFAIGQEPSDFLQYWAAGKLWLHGYSPYDSFRLFEVERLACPVPLQREDVINLWNPPFIVPLLAPLSTAPYPVARVLWTILSAAAATAGWLLAHRTVGFYESTEEPQSIGNYLLILLALTFSPLHSALQFGQISPFLLLAFVGWLYQYRRSSSPRSALCGGCVFALTFAKPHLLWLVYAILALQIKQRPILLTWIGSVLMICAGSLIAVLLVPSIGTEYRAALSHPLQMFKTPTLGSFLYEWTGQKHTVVRLIPTILGGGGFLWWYVRSAASHSLHVWLYIAIPWSLLLSPYGWHFDQMLLLPSILWCISRCANMHRWAGIAATIIALVMNLGVGILGETQQSTIWFTVFWALAISVVAGDSFSIPARTMHREPIPASV